MNRAYHEVNPMKLRAIIFLIVVFGSVGQVSAESETGFDWLDDYRGKSLVLSPSVNANPFTYMLITEDLDLYIMNFCDFGKDTHRCGLNG